MDFLKQLDKNVIRDRLFIAAWSLCLISRLLELTEWHALSESAAFLSVVQYMEYLSAGLAVLAIILNFVLRKYNWKAVVAYGLLAVVIGLSAYFSANRTLVLVFLILGAAYGQSGRRILTVSAIITVAFLLIVVVCSQIGLAPNENWNRWDETGVLLRTRESLGFIYASTGASLFFCFVLQYVFLRKEHMRLWELAILELIQVFFFIKTDSRFPFYLGTAVIIFFTIESLFKKPWRFTSHLKWLLYAIPGLIGIISVAGCFLFNPASSFWQTIDRFLSSRMTYGKSALTEFGVKILGQPITWIGHGAGKETGVYNYVDCSYMQILIQYGVLVLLAILVLYTIGMIRSVKAKDYWTVCLLGIVCIYSMTEPYLLNLAVAPIPLLAVSVLGEEGLVYQKGWLCQIFHTPRTIPSGMAEEGVKKPVSVKKNFVMNAILTVSTFIFPLITFPYISRVLLSAGTGRVSFARSIIAYFGMIAALGIPTYGIRACAKVRDDKEKLSRTAQELLIINVIMSLVAYALLALAIIFIPKLRAEKTLLIVVSATIIFTTIGMEWLFKAMEQYTYITIRSIVFNAIALVLMFLLVHKQSDYVIYGAITIVASSLGYILNLIQARKYIQMKPIGSFNLKQHLKPVLVFFAMAAATTVYTNLDQVMLGFMKTETDVGYYHAAVRIKEILVAIVTSLGAVLLPRVSYYIQNGMMEEFRRITKKAINFVFVFASPLMLYFIIFAKEGILLLSGSDFMGAVIPMQILMPTVLFIGLTGLLGIQILVPLGRERMVLYSVIAGAVVDLIINALLIPKMAASGAAIGTLIAEAVVLLVQLFVLRKDNIGEAFAPVQYWKIVVAMAAGSAASFWVLFLHVGNIFILLISAVLFFAVYAGVLLLLKEPMAREIIDIVIRYFHKGSGEEQKG